MAEHSGNEIIVEYLIKEKIPYILGYAGHGAIGFWTAFTTGRIRFRSFGHA